MKVRRALISVSDKKGLDRFVKGLDKLGIEILSTGGTAQFIRRLGITVTDVSGYTGFPEIMDGRVKTLHPKIHGALLALRDKSEHMQQAKEHAIELIDMVIVNLYPFVEVTSRKGVAMREAIENIDIGGPSMLRSAAKNYAHVAVVSDPGMYDAVLEELKTNDRSLKEETLQRLALDTFRKTSEYDKAIFSYLANNNEGAIASTDLFPQAYNPRFEKVKDLRYGENPHQKAALYRDSSSVVPSSIASAQQLHGKELSFNNIMDLNAALEVVQEFNEPAACIIKHATPCGVAVARDIKETFADAFECDRMSAFGGIIGLNRELDESTASEIAGAGFIECILAPRYDKKALRVLTKKKNIRLVQIEGIEKATSTAGRDFKKIRGGALLQEQDNQDVAKSGIKVVTKKHPTGEELDSLIFAWRVVKHVKSNAIVLCQGTKTVGIGAGQMSRVDSVLIAIRKAGQKVGGSVLASDAFFPKPDSIEAAHKAGVCAVIQPGGSIADPDVIAAADAAGISMVFTGIRHFKH